MSATLDINNRLETGLQLPNAHSIVPDSVQLAGICSTLSNFKPQAMHTSHGAEKLSGSEQEAPMSRTDRAMLRH